MTDIEEYIRSCNIPAEDTLEAITQYLDAFNRLWFYAFLELDVTASEQAKPEA